MWIEQGGGDLHLKIFIVVQQIDQRRGIDRRIAHQLAGCLIKFGTTALQVGVRFGIPHQGGCGAYLR